MKREDVRPGAGVLIEAKDEFFAYVNGWHGRVSSNPHYPGGWNNGFVVVECARADGLKTFFVPADQLAASV